MREIVFEGNDEFSFSFDSTAQVEVGFLKRKSLKGTGRKLVGGVWDD